MSGSAKRLRVKWLAEAGSDAHAFRTMPNGVPRALSECGLSRPISPVESKERCSLCKYALDRNRR